MRIKIAVLLSIAALASAFLRAEAAFIGSAPSVMEVFVEPGKAVSGEFTVTNPDEERKTVEIEIQNYWKQQTGQEGLDPAKWLKLDIVKEFKLGPKESRVIKYKIRLPVGFCGEAMAMIFFNTDAPGGAMNMQLRHGIPIYALVKKMEDIKIETTGVDIRKAESAGGNKIAFGINMKNTGKIHVRPKGSVKIIKDGALVKEIPMEYGYPLFPNAQYRYAGKYAAENIEPGNYSAVFSMDCGFLNSSGVPLEESVDFVVSESGDVVTARR